MKRNLSDSDADDVFDDSKGTPTQSNESCQMLNRKKRRGIIEKRRRDRINNSLTELRRLVPTAFEKQGSAKLEKAEILQMTVDHLKMLHAKGFDAFAFDPHKFAMDYHSIGFRECAAEVARYLVTMEGMDVQDPLRLRLMSHLQCYSAQRELASKQAHAGWGTFNPSSQFANPFPPHPSDQPPPPHHAPPLSCSEPRSQPMAPTDPLGMGGSHMRLPPGGSVAPAVAMTPGGSGSSSTAAVSLGTGTGTPQGPGAAQYPVSLNISTHCFPTSSPNSYSPTATTTQAGPPVKPYRPWGAELAY